jgi:hypothetical protein
MNGIAYSAFQALDPASYSDADGYRCLPPIRDWPAEFKPYAPGYQPHTSKCRVSTQANWELKPLLVPKSVEEKKTYTTTKKRSTVPKCHNISAINKREQCIPN